MSRALSIGMNMTALFTIGWFVALLVSIAIVFEFVGWSGLIRMFPEGRRWWVQPLQWLSLILFALVVIFNPWGYHGVQ